MNVNLQRQDNFKIGNVEMTDNRYDNEFCFCLPKKYPKLCGVYVHFLERPYFEMERAAIKYRWQQGLISGN